MNHVEMLGAVTGEPTMRYTSGGLAILELPIAGRSNDRAWYHRVTLFGGAAEEYATAEVGSAVHVVGRLDFQMWESNGERRSALKVIGNTIVPGAASTSTDQKGQPLADPGVNRVVIAGNLTRDAKTHQTSNGNQVVSASIAINEKHGDKEKTHFVDLSAWSDDGTLAAGSKGDRAIITGSLRTRSWEADGTRKYATEVNVDSASVAGRTPAPAPSSDRLDLGDELDESAMPF